MKKLIIGALACASSVAFIQPAAAEAPTAKPARTAAKSTPASDPTALKERMAQRQLDLLIASVLAEDEQTAAKQPGAVLASARR